MNATTKNAVDLELGDFWYWLDERNRRALCVLAHVDPDDCAGRAWRELGVDERMHIIRGMTELAALAIEAAHALQTARAELERAAREPTIEQHMEAVQRAFQR